LPGVSVKIESGRADETFFSYWVPNSRGIASSTLIAGIKIRSSCGAFAVESLSIED
jgi:hypothetical protein